MSAVCCGNCWINDNIAAYANANDDGTHATTNDQPRQQVPSASSSQFGSLEPDQRRILISYILIVICFACLFILNGTFWVFILFFYSFLTVEYMKWIFWFIYLLSHFLPCSCRGFSILFSFFDFNFGYFARFSELREPHFWYFERSFDFLTEPFLIEEHFWLMTPFLMCHQNSSGAFLAHFWMKSPSNTPILIQLCINLCAITEKTASERTTLHHASKLYYWWRKSMYSIDIDSNSAKSKWANGMHSFWKMIIDVEGYRRI